MRFEEGVLLLTPHKSGGPEHGPYPPRYLESLDRDPVVVEALNNECVMGALVRGDTLYAVCARKTQEGYENLVIASRDTQEWWSVASFSSGAYAVSLEEADGRFCVGLGCGYQTKRGVPPPKAAGDILCVTPKPDILAPPQ